MDFKTTLREDGLVVENGQLVLKIGSDLCLKPYLLAESRALSIAASENSPGPAFQARLGGYPVNRFQVDWEKLSIETISDSLGPGRRIILQAKADQYGHPLYTGARIEARVSLSFYENLPLAIIGQAEFTNLGKDKLTIDQLAGNCYRLDRRLVTPGERPWRFASYQGAAYRWGRDYSLIWIENDTERTNFMGADPLNPAEGEFGGTPLVDLWAPECGLAVASAEPLPQWISLPVRTLPDGTVEISVAEVPEKRFGQKTTLAPGESCTTIRSAVILHRLDFHDALRVYGDILRGQGVNIPSSSPDFCYAPYWKSWGFGLDFKLDQIYGVLEEIKSFGIEMAMLDDGWFTLYGDWKPNPAPEKFPGGDEDMRRFIRRVKKAGFKTSIWWYPQGVSPESDLAREHPDWLIMNEDGSFPRCMRKLYFLCPEHPEAVAYIASLTEKFLRDWDYDGLYLDTTGQSAAPPCFNPAHNHQSPLDSFTGDYKLYQAIYKTAQRIKPGCPVEMCICGIPHDPFKMPYYNVANASDPVNLSQMRQRIKVEKAFRGPSFCVGDCYQIPMDEWDEWSVPESFESAMGTGAQMTTLYSDLSAEQIAKWKRWFQIYQRLRLSSGEYLNLYDIAFDRPEAHVVRKDGKLYYGFFAERWSRQRPIVLRGLEPGKTYRVYDYANEIDLGTVSADKPEVRRSFRESLLLEVSPVG